MNFRICKKYCGMKSIYVSSYIDEWNRNGTCNFITVRMTGDNGRHCSFAVDGYEFTGQFARKMENLMASGCVKKECGHDFDPAFSTKRHVKLLEEIDIMEFGNGFRGEDHVCGCRYCELHCIDYGRKNSSFA